MIATSIINDLQTLYLNKSTIIILQMLLPIEAGYWLQIKWLVEQID